MKRVARTGGLASGMRKGNAGSPAAAQCLLVLLPDDLPDGVPAPSVIVISGRG
jgi:hypothetical protein